MNIFVTSLEERNAQQRFKNKCKLVCGICITVIGYLIFQY